MIRPPFLRGVLDATLPLWLWAAQFAFGYGWAAAACHAGFAAAWVRGPIALAGAATALPVAWLLWRACRSRDEGLLAAVRALAALLALVGIVWQTAPVFLLPACRWA